MVRAGWVLAVVALLCACKKKAAEPPPEPEPAKPVVEVKPPPVETPSTPDPWLDAPRKPAPPVSPPPDDLAPFRTLPEIAADAKIETVLDEIRRVTPADITILRLEALYVRQDGTLDPTYGSLVVRFGLSDALDGVADDPNRPTGAPVPVVKQVERVRTECPELTLEKGAWRLNEHPCNKVEKAMTFRCTMADVWKRAIAAGAPSNAVATIRRDAEDQIYVFAIEDKVRKVSFKAYPKDDCAAAGSGSAAKPLKKPNPYAGE